MIGCSTGHRRRAFRWICWYAACAVCGWHRGLSENIRVTSIIGRFLEHSRIYYFRNGGQEEIYCGSADLMPRNLDRRVEIVFPVENPKLVRRLKDEILGVYLSDSVNGYQMQSDGSYLRAPRGQTAGGVDSHVRLGPRTSA